MAIADTTSSALFTGNNSTVTAYVIPFRFDNPAWLSVARVDAAGVAYALVLGVGFTLSGSNLKTTVAIPPTEKLRVLRNTPAVQGVQSSPPVQSYQADLEGQLDQTTMAVQDVARNAAAADAAAIIDAAAAIVATAAASATSASASATSANSSKLSAATSEANAAASATLAQSASPIPPGPYATAQDAIAAGVQFGRTFFKADFSAAVARYRAGTVRLFGDSIMNYSTSYTFSIIVANGSNFGLRYQIRATTPNPHLISVQHVNPGGTGALSVAFASNKLTVTLARSGGVATSTLAQVKAAVIAAAGDKFIVLNTYGPDTTLAVASAEMWAFDESYSGPNGVWIWIQALLGQRFDLARRKTLSGYQFESSSEGDWDFGYPGFRADQLLGNPGPLGDLLAQPSDLIVGMAGTNDHLQGAPAATIASRISALWDALIAAKQQFVWMEVPPHGVAANETVVEATNALLRPMAIAKGVTLFRWDPSMVSGGAALPLYFGASDPTHPTDAACYKQAVYMLSQVDGFIQPTAPVYTNPADGNWLTTNSNLTGSVSGVATGFTNNSPSIITPTKTGGDVQRLVFAQTAGVYNPALFSAPFATTGWVAGDLIEGVITVTVSPTGLDMKGLEGCLYFAGVSSNPSISAMKAADYDPLRFTGTSKPGTYVLRTLPTRIPHGATGISVTLQGYGNASIDISNMGVRKSIQPY